MTLEKLLDYTESDIAKEPHFEVCVCVCQPCLRTRSLAFWPSTCALNICGHLAPWLLCVLHCLR